jgi:hypothetical protein
MPSLSVPVAFIYYHATSRLDIRITLCGGKYASFWSWCYKFNMGPIPMPVGVCRIGEASGVITVLARATKRTEVD